MELRQLAYFVAVAEEHNFTRAAERIPIAQPVISQRIRRLEAELGEHLFVRDRRGARLTPAGQTLLPHARTTLRAADGGREAVAALSGLLAGRGQVPLRALRAEPMVTLTRASKLRTTLETACQAAGFAPRIVAETSDLGVMVELAAEKVGVAVLPATGPKTVTNGQRGHSGGSWGGELAPVVFGTGWPNVSWRWPSGGRGRRPRRSGWRRCWSKIGGCDS